MFKQAIVSCCILMSSLVLAQDLTQSAQELIMTSEKISKIAQRIDYGNAGARAKRRLKLQLKQLIDQAELMKQQLTGRGGNGPLPVPGPGPIPNPYGVSYTAECHIDDDVNLDFNQQVIMAKGDTIDLLIQDCKTLAQITHPRGGHSSGIAKIKLIGRIPVGAATAVCHVDDDVNLTYDQHVPGVLVGQTLNDVLNDCKKLAKHAYGNSHSSGLLKVNEHAIIPNYAVTAVCHIDDDVNMTYDQNIQGVVFGQTLQQVAQDCQMLARATYGASSSSGLKDINR
ncbi:MAG: hypothetical protein QF441_01110 [Bacteriovoracaceae bacterium]|jgi:hypothetical protein|nr:hypothetical protein [Bacteriovoracaceae bacterium]